MSTALGKSGGRCACSASATLAAVRETVGGYPGLRHDVRTYGLLPEDLDRQDYRMPGDRAGLYRSFETTRFGATPEAQAKTVMRTYGVVVHPLHALAEAAGDGHAEWLGRVWLARTKLLQDPDGALAIPSKDNGLDIEGLPQVAFSGRSNVGKSSLINRVLEAGVEGIFIGGSALKEGAAAVAG